MTSAPPVPLGEIAITGRIAVSCLGRGERAHIIAMEEGRSGLTRCDFPNIDMPCFIGRVEGIEEDRFPDECRDYDNRAARLAMAALTAGSSSCVIDRVCTMSPTTAMVKSPATLIG